MKSFLYCIKHEKEVAAYHGVVIGLFHLHTIQINNSPDPGTRYDLEECGFEDGWATVSPPEFDIELFAETAESELEDGWGIYGYDVETDQIITEV